MNDMQYWIMLCERNSVLDNAAFQNWFKGSKVVDHAGHPQVMYHGTMYSFTEFAPGSHFGDITAANTRLAHVHAGELPRFRKHLGAVMPVYLSIQNPLRITDDGGLVDGYDLAQAVFKLGILTKQELHKITDTGSPGVSKLRLFQLLSMRGYDGFVYQNQIESKADSWCLLEPIR